MVSFDLTISVESIVPSLPTSCSIVTSELAILSQFEGLMYTIEFPSMLILLMLSSEFGLWTACSRYKLHVMGKPRFCTMMVPSMFDKLTAQFAPICEILARTICATSVFSLSSIRLSEDVPLPEINSTLEQSLGIVSSSTEHGETCSCRFTRVLFLNAVTW